MNYINKKESQVNSNIVMTHHFHYFVGLAVILSMALANSAPAGDQDKRPNIIFFVADDMRPHHFNCLPEGEGKNLTPNIDRLAREGTLMSGQHVVAPVCTPSRYCCLTGRYPSRAQNAWFKQTTEKNGDQTVVEFNSHIIPSDVTLPRLLKQAGYATGMAGKNHVVDVHGLKQFDDFDASAKLPGNVSKLKANHDHVCQAMRDIGFDYAASVYHNNPDFLGLHDVAVQNMDWITKGGLDFIDQYHHEPFFLYLATTVPHAPDTEDRSWNANPLITAVGYLDEPLDVQPARETIPKRLKAAGLPVSNDTANMLWLDDALGALIDKLDETGELENTIILFFNDHGQNSKGTLYQGGVYDPSIIWRAGGFDVGSECSALVSNVDFAPTLLDFAGADSSQADFNGKSFVPYLNGGEQEPGRVLYSELGYARGIRKGDLKYIAVRYPEDLENMSLEERTKVLEEWNAERHRKHLKIVTTDPTKPFSHLTPIPGGGHAEAESTGKYPGYFDRDQLYDLSIDPKELNNLANNPEYVSKLAAMKALLEEQVRDLPGSFGEFGK